MNRLILALICIGLSSSMFAQGTEASAEKSPASIFKYSGFMDTYYATDNDAYATQNRVYLNPLNITKNTFALNIIQVTAQADAEKYHAKFTLQYGDVSQYDWISTGEDILVPSNRIQEAYVGLCMTEGLWVDAGYFLTHIGGEAICPRDNWLASVALTTQFEPFFQSGVRVSYDLSSDLNMGVHVLNGYNRFTDNNEDKSLGYSVSYKLSPSTTIALNGIAGNEQASRNEPLTRVLNDLVVNSTLSEKLALKVVVDVATQKQSADAASTSVAYGAFASLRYSLTSQLFATTRAELFHDADGILSGNTKLCAHAATLGLEFRPIENAYLRCETRYMTDYDMDNALFMSTEGSPSHHRIEGMFSLGVAFN